MPNGQYWVAMKEVHFFNTKGEIALGLKRGEWVEQEGWVGIMGFADPENATKPSGYRHSSQELFLIAETSGSAEYLTIPLSCLSESFFASSNELFISVDPEPQGDVVTLIEVEFDGEGSKLEVTLAALAKDLGETEESVRDFLKENVLSRDERGWFNPEADERHRKVVTTKQ